FFNGKRSVGNVVVDTYCEVVLQAVVKVLVNGKDHGRSEFLADQTVTTANNVKCNLLFSKSGNNVKVKRFTQRACFLCSATTSNLLYCLGKCSNKLVCNERTVQSYFKYADLFALLC